MRTVIRKNTWTPGLDTGWGNGYVLVPKGHPFYGVYYDEIDVDVHGGLTFSELVDAEIVKRWPGLTDDDIGFWIIGFDTAHARDTLSRWPKEAVQAETDRLLEQVKNAGG